MILRNDYQPKRDDSLNTSDKTIVGSINELLLLIKKLEDKINALEGGSTPGPTPTTYTITRNLANCTSSNNTSSVTQGASYSTTVTPNSGYELMNVAITMGGTNVTSSVYKYQNGNAVINIPSVTGNVVITVQATSSGGGTDPTPNTYKITNNLTNCKTNNSATSIDKGSSYTAIITANDGYTLSDVKVTMGGNNITDNTITASSTEVISIDGTVSGETLIITNASVSGETLVFKTSSVTKYTVNIPSVNGDIVITAKAVSEPYTISRDLSNCSIDNSSSSVEKNARYTATLTANDGYEFKNNVTVTMNGTDITSSVVTYED